MKLLIVLALLLAGCTHDLNKERCSQGSGFCAGDSVGIQYEESEIINNVGIVIGVDNYNWRLVRVETPYGGAFWVHETRLVRRP